MTPNQTAKIKNQTSDADAEAIEAAKTALEPLARISTQGERLAVRPADAAHGEPPAPTFTGVYRVHRCRRQATITAQDIQAARAACEDPKATLEDCRKALRPLAKLPVDSRVEAPGVAIYTFPAEDGPEVSITNAMIEAAQDAMA